MIRNASPRSKAEALEEPEANEGRTGPADKETLRLDESMDDLTDRVAVVRQQTFAHRRYEPVDKIDESTGRQIILTLDRKH